MKRYFDEDIEILAQNEAVMGAFAGKGVFITGATGLIGSVLAKALCAYEDKNHTGLKVYALARSREKARKVFTDPAACLQFITGDVNALVEVPGRVDYIIHAASITSSKMFVEQPVETIGTLIGGTKNVLELARKHPVEKVIYLSSLEAYGVPGQQSKVTEDFVGHIDYTAIRSSYSEGKRLAECLCNSYHSEYGIPVVTARLSQTFGPGVSYQDGRVFAQFARSVIEGTDIGLNTAGRTFRNYCYIRDAAAAIFTILAKGAPGEAYNVANKDTGISIADMAQMVCREFGEGKSKVVFHNPESLGKFGYNPEMHIELVTDKLESLGWQAEVGLKEMYARLIHDMKLERV